MNASVTITNCLMDYNDMGIMTSTASVDNLLVQNTEISFNGTGQLDGLSHNVYLTTGTTVTFSYCYIHDSVSGENFKSRAHYTQLFYNYIADGAESEVEGLDNPDTVGPNSNMTMIGNILVSTPNRTINTVKFINFGQDEGGTHNGTLYLIDNTLIAGSTSIGFLRSSASNSAIVAVNNILYGSDNIVQAGIANNISGSNNWFPTNAIMPPGFSATVSGTDPGFLNAAGFDFHLIAGSAARNIGLTAPVYYDGTGISHSGVPLLQYVQPLSSATRPIDTGLDAGAYGFGAIAGGTPDLTIAGSHTGNFTQGQSGIYTITVGNSGSAATSGTVTMNDTLPTGLTAANITGTGWTCSLSPLSCSRGDALAPGNSYPAITLPVSVAGNAPSSVTNIATVSGGSETNTSNDTSQDVTNINASAPTAGSASYVRTDTLTAGSWKGVYGGDGFSVIDDVTSYPSYVTVTPAGPSSWLWTSTTTDVRALERQASGRIAACWYSAASFTVDLNFTDGNTHLVALYVLDWDNYYGRTERLDVLDGNGNVLDTRNMASFQGGQYVVWNLAGHVVIRVTNTNSISNAVVSGLFFGPPPAGTTAGTAAFVKSDTTTAGSWKGVYGADGANVIGDMATYPSYVTVTPAGNSFWGWASSTTDPRAPQKVSSTTDRVAACWYSSTSFSVALNFSDANTHQVALYLLDWDNYFGRTERLDVLDVNGNILDSRSVAGFYGGQYLVWNLTGQIVIQITNTNPSSNAVMSGLFFR